MTVERIVFDKTKYNVIWTVCAIVAERSARDLNSSIERTGWSTLCLKSVQRGIEPKKIDSRAFIRNSCVRADAHNARQRRRWCCCCRFYKRFSGRRGRNGSMGWGRSRGWITNGKVTVYRREECRLRPFTVDLSSYKRIVERAGGFGQDDLNIIWRRYNVPKNGIVRCETADCIRNVYALWSRLINCRKKYDCLVYRRQDSPTR